MRERPEPLSAPLPVPERARLERADLERSGAPRRIRWHQPELAWPLALATGFVGTLLGLASGIPGLPALLATAAFAPLYVRLLGRRLTVLAAATSVAWTLSLAAAVTGAGLMGSPEDVRALLPFADPDALAAVGLGPGEPHVASGAVLLAWRLAACLGLVLVARPLRGVWTLLAVAVFVGAVSGVAAGWAAGEARSLAEVGLELGPVRAVLGGWPPALLLALLGSLVACAGVADPAPLLPLSELSRPRRRLLASGLLVAGAALFFEPLYAPLLRLGI